MANQKLIDDYKWFFEKKIGKAYGLDKHETEILRGVYERIARKAAEKIRNHIDNLKKAYEDYKKDNELTDGEISRAINIEVRKYIEDEKQKAIKSYTKACKKAIKEFDLSEEEQAIITKYWDARWAEITYTLEKEFSVASSAYQAIVKRYDLNEEDLIDLIAALSAAYILL